MHTLDSVAIGARIREVRGDSTQQAFAARLGVGRVSIARYETGERTPDAEFVARICTRCGVDPLWLLLGQQTAREPAPSAPVPQEGEGLAPDEIELLLNYRRGGNADQRLIQGVARHTAKNPTQEVFDPEVARERGRRAADPTPLERPTIVRRRTRKAGHQG